MPINITMPALSPTMEEGGNLAKWLVKEGDKIKSGDVIAEIETDKATMEVEAVDEGTVAKIVIPAGTEGVKVNALIAVLAGEGEDVAAAASGAAAPAAAPAAGGTSVEGRDGSRSIRTGRTAGAGRACGPLDGQPSHLRIAARPPPCQGIRYRSDCIGRLRSAWPGDQEGHRSRCCRWWRSKGCSGRRSRCPAGRCCPGSGRSRAERHVGRRRSQAVRARFLRARTA